mgnify:CR=1 FL=1
MATARLVKQLDPNVKKFGDCTTTADVCLSTASEFGSSVPAPVFEAYSTFKPRFWV